MNYKKIFEKYGVEDPGRMGAALDEILNAPIEVPIVVGKNGKIPTRATSGSGGYDLYTSEDVVVNIGRFSAPLDISFSLPKGYVAIIKARSGFTLKGMELLNQWGQKVRKNARVNDGVVDSDYTGIVRVMMESAVGACVLPKGTKVAQMLIVRAHDVDWKKVESLDDTERGSGGFGHSDD